MINKKRMRGSVLLVVLLVLVILSALAWRMAYATRMQVRIRQRQQQQTQAYYSALSGFEAGVAALVADKRANRIDSLEDDWVTEFSKSGKPRRFALRFQDSEVAGTWMVTIIDEHSRVNVNQAPQAVLQQLVARAGSKQPEALAAALTAHRIAVPQVSGFRSSFELLGVKGMDPGLLVGEDANFNGWLDPEEDDGQQRDPPDNANTKLEQGPAAYITIFTDSRVNVNTAALAVLASLPGMNEERARAVIEARQRDPFDRLEAVGALGMIPPQSWAEVASWLTVSSDLYTVISEGRDAGSGALCRIRAVVDRSADQPRVLYWREEYS